MRSNVPRCYYCLEILTYPRYKLTAIKEIKSRKPKRESFTICAKCSVGKIPKKLFEKVQEPVHTFMRRTEEL